MLLAFRERACCGSVTHLRPHQEPNLWRNLFCPVPRGRRRKQMENPHKNAHPDSPYRVYKPGKSSADPIEPRLMILAWQHTICSPGACPIQCHTHMAMPTHTPRLCKRDLSAGDVTDFFLLFTAEFTFARRAYWWAWRVISPATPRPSPQQVRGWPGRAD